MWVFQGGENSFKKHGNHFSLSVLSIEKETSKNTAEIRILFKGARWGKKEKKFWEAIAVKLLDLGQFRVARGSYRQRAPFPHI